MRLELGRDGDFGTGGDRFRPDTTAGRVVGTRNGRLHSDHNRNHAGRTTGADPVRVVRIGLRRRAIGHRIRIGSVVGAVPLIALTRGLRRRAVLVSAILGFGVFNLVTALSSNLVLTLGVRFLAGMAAGVVWGLLAGYARRMSPPHLQGRAVAVASVGQPIALAIGVPMGAWLGTLADWRVVFAVMSVTALLLVAWILTVMPDFPGQQADRQLPVWKVLVLPGVRPILFVAFLWILAHNIVYTYLAAFLDRIGFGDRLGIVLFVFGLFAFVGIGVVRGCFVDRAFEVSPC